MGHARPSTFGRDNFHRGGPVTRLRFVLIVRTAGAILALQFSLKFIYELLCRFLLGFELLWGMRRIGYVDDIARLTVCNVDYEEETIRLSIDHFLESKNKRLTFGTELRGKGRGESERKVAIHTRADKL